MIPQSGSAPGEGIHSGASADVHSLMTNWSISDVEVGMELILLTRSFQNDTPRFAIPVNL